MEWILLWAVLAVVTGLVAHSRGRSGFGWGLGAFLLSPLALVLVALLPSKVAPPVVVNGEPVSDATHVRCDRCRELIRRDATVCRHCGAERTPEAGVAALPGGKDWQRCGKCYGRLSPAASACAYCGTPVARAA